MKGTLVFDGAHNRDEESGLSYPSPLTVAYAPKGQSADEYIVEYIHLSKNPKQIIVITNDRGLRRHAIAGGAKVIHNKEFIQNLSKKKTIEKFEPKETQTNFDRLLKIFEEKLKNEND